MIKLYNTLNRKKELFKPLHKERVGLYACGPTVYSYVQIGNLRTFIFQDILKRTLEHSGRRVKHIMNITDVDDKTIRGANAAKKSLKEFTRRHEKLFKEDLKKLNIRSPTRFTRATEHIKSMIKMISVLLKREFAYKKDGSIYFDISKFRTYGKLAHLDMRGLKAGARVDADEYAKDDVQDFVLWKAAKPGEPSWPASFGSGRPGWHIECSAMSAQYLGKTFDIHTGGVDLIFPHHENEIAQSEAAYGKPFVRYWIHGEHLLVNGQKMSKSRGNFYTLRDVEAEGFSPLAFRYLVLTTHYRSKLNFTWKSLEAAQNSLERLYDFVSRLNLDSGYRGLTSIGKFKRGFQETLFNDLDTPKAIAVIWKLAHAYNKNPQKLNPQNILKLLYDFDKVLGLGFSEVKKETLPAKIKKLAAEREQYRQEKNWAKADEMRNQIKKLGYMIEDTPSGPFLKKI